MLCTYQGAGRTRPRSALTGSMLPTTLREMSPCDVAESVIGRPQNTSSWTDSEAECRDAVCVGSANLVLSGGKTISFRSVTRCDADTRQLLGTTRFKLLYRAHDDCMLMLVGFCSRAEFRGYRSQLCPRLVFSQRLSFGA